MNIQGLFSGTPRHNPMWRDSFLVVAGIAVVFGAFASSARGGSTHWRIHRIDFRHGINFARSYRWTVSDSIGKRSRQRVG